jgi:translation initiation factor 1A
MYKSNIQHKKSRAGRYEKKRELIYPEEGQEYAFVQDMLGNGRLKAYCEDGVVRVGRIRGSMRKFKRKVIINMGDIIIISRRDYEDDKVDVIHKYSFEEANKLNYNKELPEKIRKVYQQKDVLNSCTHEDDDYIEFAEEEKAGSSSRPEDNDASSGEDGSGDEEGAGGNTKSGADWLDIDAI